MRANLPPSHTQHAAAALSASSSPSLLRLILSLPPPTPPFFSCGQHCQASSGNAAVDAKDAAFDACRLHSHSAIYTDREPPQQPSQIFLESDFGRFGKAVG